MAIDIAADIADILGSDADFTRTEVTWTKSDGTTSDSVTGILWELDAEALDEGTLDRLAGLFVVAVTEFTNVTVRSPFDTIAVAGKAPYRIVTVKERQAHVFVQLAKDVQRGRSA